MIYSKEKFCMSQKMQDLRDIKHIFAVYNTKSQFDHIKLRFIVIKKQFFPYMSQNMQFLKKVWTIANNSAVVLQLLK